MTQAPIPETTKNIARDLYLEGGKTQTSIAAQLGVHPKTISYWIKQNQWDDMKASLRMSPVIIKQNLYAQLEAFSEYILTREEGNHFPDTTEVTIQYKLVTAISKFPNYSYEEIMDMYKDLYPSNQQSPTYPARPEKIPSIDKDSTKTIDSQSLIENTRDKEGIKMDKETSPQTIGSSPENTSYIPKKNIVLRSGARWIEKGMVFDPKMKQNRKLTRPEWDELLQKGLTKADFQGWHPAS